MLNYAPELESPANPQLSRRSPARRLAILAPSHLSRWSHRVFKGPQNTAASRANQRLAQVQTLRGRIYLNDGAISEEQMVDGRHEVDADWRSWHLLILNEADWVLGCARLTPHSNQTRFADLGVSGSWLAKSLEWGTKLEAAVESELNLSREHGVPYIEFGGWALDESIRGTAEALRMVLAIYGLAQELGGAIGVSTATTRHCSASILRRLGAFSLEDDGMELPPYFDPQYNCQMEVLRFRSWTPNPRYMPWIEEIKCELRNLTEFTLAGTLLDTTCN